jgi:hypothetical protein
VYGHDFLISDLGCSISDLENMEAGFAPVFLLFWGCRGESVEGRGRSERTLAMI